MADKLVELKIVVGGYIMDSKYFKWGEVDTIPSREWKRRLHKELSEIIESLKMPQLYELLDMTDYYEILIKMVELMDGFGRLSSDEKIALSDFEMKLSVYFALNDAYEVVVNDEVKQDWFKKDENFGFNFEKLKHFRIPCEGIIILFKKGNKYSNRFLHCFKMLETYKRGDIESEIILMKHCGIMETGKNKYDFGILSEYTVIPELLPRIFASCNYLNNGCKHGIVIDLRSRVVNKIKGAINLTDLYCIRSPRTLDFCQDTNENMLLAYSSLSIVDRVVDYLTNRKIIDKSTGELRERSERVMGDKQVRKGIKKDLFIDLSAPIVRQKSTVKGQSKGHKHASPREHIRRAHYRLLKSGKVVRVRSTIVNKGKTDKVSYTISKDL